MNQPFTWNGPLCPTCHGTTWVPINADTAKKCPDCKGSGLGKIGHGKAYTTDGVSENFSREGYHQSDG